MTLLSALFHAWQTAQKLAQNRKKVQYQHIRLVLWAQLLLSLCLAVCLFLCLSVYVTVLSFVSSSVVCHSDELLAFSWIQQLALYCWRWCSLFLSLPRVSSPLTIFSFHIRHFVSSIIWNTVVFVKLDNCLSWKESSLLDAGNSCNLCDTVSS